ncbi:4-(cytidine 5'-diphospho)-2-C-methyl-D-erythritol kinase [Limosilactobacillus sp.]|uniref:4-(cytidine 5'-diphospho)-2-C-methyl-D-erythritol kinase n=1 Tax=Limosilactobacillus sp. TaxID=2773925 RepID=UPI00345E29F1
MIIHEKAPAKINLALDTPMRYLDGLPKWDMVMASVDLADYVTVETHDRPQTIKVYTDSCYLPNDQRNLAFQAAHILKSRFHIAEGVTIKIRKHIPVAAGLGGGSSDAAAVLRALNNVWRLGLRQNELAQLSLSIDSDVPYCVYGTTARVTGHGERVEVLPSFPHYWAVIAKQKISVSTPSILRQINYEELHHLQTDALVEAIRQGDWPETFHYMGNVLEPLTAAEFPQIKRIKQQMIKLGADAAQMSGTGPTMFALCHNESRARRIENGLRGFCREVYRIMLL